MQNTHGLSIRKYMNMHFAGDTDTKDEGEDGNLDDNNDENKGKLSSLMKRKAHTRIWNVFSSRSPGQWLKAGP